MIIRGSSDGRFHDAFGSIPESWMRRAFKQGLVKAFKKVGFALLVGLSFSIAQGAGKRPNIIIILADDMGFSDAGCYGGEIHTPNLDYLAGNGLRFRQFYNTSRCCPSRASLLTGLYNHQAGIGKMTNDDHEPGYRGYITENSVTLAEVLKSAG